MATKPTTTDPAGQGTYFKYKDTLAETAASRAFGMMLMRLKDMISAETRIETGALDVLGLELMQDLRIAERSRETLIEAAFDVIACPDACPEDRGLRRMAVLLTTFIQMEDDTDRQQLHAQTNHHRDVFDIIITGPGARHARRLQMAFFQHFDALGSLQEFGGTGIALDAHSDALEPTAA